MPTEHKREDTKVQARVDAEVKTDLKKMAEERHTNLGALVSKLLTNYWIKKKRKGEC